MERLPVDEAAEQLARLYEEAEGRLRVAVREALASGLVGGVTYRRRRLGLIRDLLARLQHAALPRARKLIEDSYKFGGKLAESVGIEASFGGGIHDDAIQLLTDNLNNSLDDATVRVGRQAEDVFRRMGLRQSALHLLEASGPEEGARSLRQGLEQQGIKAFQDRLGRSWGLGTYSRMVIRTTTREAVSEGTANNLIEGGFDLVTVSAHKHPVDICTPYDGKTFSLTGATEGYPVLDKKPPFHPNCRHVLTPAAVTFEERERGLARAVGR